MIKSSMHQLFTLIKHDFLPFSETTKALPRNTLYTVKALWADTHKRTALLTAALAKLHFTLAHTNSAFTHSRKRPAPVADTFSASRGCSLTGASTYSFNILADKSYIPFCHRLLKSHPTGAECHRFHSRRGLRFFLFNLSHARNRTENIFLISFTELKICNVILFYYHS